MDIETRLDPELAAVLAAIPSLGIDLDDIPFARSLMAKMGEMSRMPADMAVEIEQYEVPGTAAAPAVGVRLFRPRGVAEKLPVLLWIHGGGYVLGTADGSDRRCGEMALNGGCAVASVEYRLAPEHPFPAPLEDCHAALKWLAGSADALNIDASRIAIGGASAGGGLAAGLALLARDRAEVNVIFQLLIYPMIDDSNTTPSSHAITDATVWNRSLNIKGWSAYLGREPGGADVSPYAAAARAQSLDGLPPAYIPVGELDLFLDENIVYAQRLLQAGVPTELHVYTGAIHGFDMLAPQIAVSRRFNAGIDDALRRAFAR